jgi:hypothetical protein
MNFVKLKVRPAALGLLGGSFVEVGINLDYFCAYVEFDDTAFLLSAVGPDAWGPGKRLDIEPGQSKIIYGHLCAMTKEETAKIMSEGSVTVSLPDGRIFSCPVGLIIAEAGIQTLRALSHTIKENP